jgi:hypothetical protein
MRKLLVLGIAALAAVAVAGMAIAGKPGTNDTRFDYAIGLWGDLPYSALQADPGIPNLIADMNAADLAFTVDDGDLKGGNGPTANPPSVTCSDALYTTALGWFNSLEKPAVFTPGDNDWTDCDRAANGGFSSLDRLDLERQVFFGASSSLGKHPMKLEVQSTPSCLGIAGPTACVENRRWTVRGVTYATVNIQGSCNNLCDIAPDPAEYAARNAADIAWLQQTFAKATAEGSAAVMIIGQADPGFDNSDATRSPTRDPKTLVENDKLPASDPQGSIPAPDGFHDFLAELRAQTIAFRKPVVYVHGDSHYLRIDKPLQDIQGRRLENFTRVETFGDNAANGLNDVQWLKVLVDPTSRDVFAFQPQIVPANRVAVPAP